MELCGYECGNRTVQVGVWGQEHEDATVGMGMLGWEHRDGIVRQVSQISMGQSLSLQLLCYSFHRAIFITSIVSLT